METVECRDCGEVYFENQIACPNCGLKHKIISIAINIPIGAPTITVEGMQGKNPHLPSKKKLRWEWIDKDTVQRGDGVTRVHHYRLRDRDNDVYEEVVTDLTTGEVIHECKEPLSEHRGHGSDKENK